MPQAVLSMSASMPSRDVIRLGPEGGVRIGGEYHGLVLDGVTQPGLCLLNLEHYTAAGVAGRFVPRIVPEGAELSFEPTADWAVRSTIVYRRHSECAYEATFTFMFERRYEAFEAFIASYFPVSTPPPWLLCKGGWRRPQPKPMEQLFVARDEQAANRVGDGRWAMLPAAGYGYRVAKDRYAKALMLTHPAGDDRVVMQFLKPGDCSQLSPNIFAPAHDLSIVGRNVSAGETVQVPVRLVCRPSLSRADAVEMHDSFATGVYA